MALQTLARDDQQLGLYGTRPESVRRRLVPQAPEPAGGRVLCAACRAAEARYGFQDEDDPAAERPSTLCFGCFRVEINRRHAVAARLARAWNGTQVRLPLEETLASLDLRRRRAQIAARHALDRA